LSKALAGAIFEECRERVLDFVETGFLGNQISVHQEDDEFQSLARQQSKEILGSWSVMDRCEI